ncbi:regucalcin isoform X1 [Neodiprion lecontei]|uniref:Regucalcin isoform X1 n=1 Tax=Neodiprion lecontei TaxID=441921 RepID=A0A6J0BB54_NEOLC|nr:regucalcin isoform X1 [Neodiprion lecontei]
MLRLCMVLCLLSPSWGYEVEQITEPLLLGEGPHWNALTQLLYFVDITNSTIHVYDPSTGVHNYTTLDGGAVTFIIPIAGTTDEFLISTELDIRHVIWDGQQDSTPESSIIYSAVQDSDGSRFNDAKVDRSGTLWAGTMGPEVTADVITERTGKLYRVTPYSSITTQLEDLLISNGLAWSADGTIMYYTDTGDNTIDSFDFNATADNPLSNRQHLFNFTEQAINGTSDGFTIDTDGNLWLACYGGYQVIVVNPTNGSLLMSIPLNSSKVTSLAWGGQELDELYVTTAKKGLSDDELTNYPESGATYRITGLGSRGYAGDNYVMYTTTTTSDSNSLHFTKISTFIYAFIMLILTCS